MTTQTMVNRVADIWNEYQQISEQQNGLLKTLIPVNPLLECYIGYIPVTSSRVFQLAIRNEFELKNVQLSKFSGVEVQILSNLAEQQYYTVILLIDELSHVFTLFIEDVLDSLSDVKSEYEAITTVGLRINHWKNLFAKLSGESLSPEQQRGLYGELLTLKLLLTNSSDKQQILFAWQGPHGANHDFVLNETALEVKATKAGSPSLGISNEMQLDHSGWKALFISLVVLTEIKGGGATLSTLIGELREELNDDLELVSLFLSKLQLAGVPQDMLDSYDEIGYHVRAIRHFHIADGFPSIVPNDIPDAVSEVQYKVEIAGCLDFETDEQSLLSFFQ